ncbi:hypothetical protein Tco_0426024 [Tanacetum coccineum]
MILCITAQVITVLNGVIHYLLGYMLSFKNYRLVTMSSATSDVTYTSVYSDSEPGRAFWGADYEEISEGGIPRVIVLGYDGLPLQPVAPPSPDYVLGPRIYRYYQFLRTRMSVSLMFIQAHDPDYVPEPIYPERSEEYEDDETEDGPLTILWTGDDGDDDDGDSSEGFTPLIRYDERIGDEVRRRST